MCRSLLSGVLSAMAAVALFLTCTPAMAGLHDDNGRLVTPSEDIDTTYQDWMGQNKQALAGLALNQVPLLGSHDAGSYGVNRDSEPCRACRTRDGGYVTRKPRGDDISSARSQSTDILNQLRYGVRYLDLRVTKQDGEYWIEHIFLSAKVTGHGGMFWQIKEFLRQHPDEIIVLSNHALYEHKGGMNERETEEWYKLVQREFGDLLVPAGSFSAATLGSIWQGKGRLVFYGDAKRFPEPFLWDESQVEGPWMDQKNPERLCQELSSELAGWAKGEAASKMRVLEAFTTTRKKIREAEKTNRLIRERLKTVWLNAPVTVVQVDDAVNSGLMPILVNRLPGANPTGGGN
ncbi:MAG: hypothetical protein AB1921_08305 [Thermodesulfobacteriota bacterium]